MAAKNIRTVAMGPEKVKLRVKDAAESNTRLERDRAAEGAEPITRDHERTPFESFEDLSSKLLRVPKEEMNERRIEWKESRKRKQD